ncbi:serine/threonine protein kinase [Coemansia sp. RSA 2607]|nr:serine/threonine protein kinase [Coemansia sp. RSA 2607]
MSNHPDSQDMEGLNQLFQEQLLLNQVPHDVWGVLLSLTPDEYETVHLTLTKPPARKGADSANPGKFGYLIGRHKTCDIRLENKHISNRHCLIYRVESETSFDDYYDEIGLSAAYGGVGKVYLEDTSTNGTYVNGVRVRNNASVELRDGDEIQLVRYQPSKGMDYFSDRFFVFQNLAVHRRETCLFKQSYLLTDVLGKGAFAEVRVAINRVTGKRYAAKIIDRKRITQIEKRRKMDENFRIETSILSRVRHDSIVQVHGVFQECDNLYLVLDLCNDGELFDEIVKREFLQENDARRVMLQLFLAIRHLNRLGIVHRDIKLENILLEDKNDLRIKLADFGLAKIVGEQMFMKTVCGTPMYVAPEVLTVRQIGQYDNLVDMWSLGVVLYICLCGFPPFSDELSPPPMRDQIIHGIYGFPSPYWDGISDDARDLVFQMLQVDPRNRITVDAALAHPWLKARRVGSAWVIDGVPEFEVNDPDALEDSQKTQSLTAESSQLLLSQPNSGSAAPRFMQSPVATRPNIAYLPSSPPVCVAVSDSETAARDQIYSPGAPTAPIDGSNNASAMSGRKRKDPSFMRSQSDLGQMVLPKRSMHFSHHVQQQHEHMFSRTESGHTPDSGPLVMFAMSPDMSCQPSKTGGSGRNNNDSNRTAVSSRNAVSKFAEFTPMHHPKPLPRPGAQQQHNHQQQQQQQHQVQSPFNRFALPVARPAASRGCSLEVSGISDDACMSRQPSAGGQQLPTFFDFSTTKRV